MRYLLFVIVFVTMSYAQHTSVQITSPVPTLASQFYGAGVTYAMNNELTIKWKSYNSLNLFNINLINRKTKDTLKIRNYNDTSYFFSSLDYFTDYTFQIQPYDTAPSAWGKWTNFSFSTPSLPPLPQVVLVNPPKVYDSTSILKWYKVRKATYYSVIVINNTTSWYWGGGRLLDTMIDLKYYLNGSKDITKFTIIITPYCDTLPYNPLKSEENQDTLNSVSLHYTYTYYFTKIQLNHIASPTSNKRPIFSWSNIDSSYYIEIASNKEIGLNKAFTNNVLVNSWVLYDSTFKPSSDLANGKIYWHVAPKILSSFFSDVDSLIIFTPIVLNHIQSSSNKRPVFSWNKATWSVDDTAYLIQIDTLKSFSTAFHTILKDTFFIPSSDLSTKTIYWRVSDIKGYSAAIDSFTVYKTPTLNHISSSINKRPVFSWTKADTSYILQIDSTKTFSSSIKNVIVKDTFYNLTTDLPTKTIYWRVSNSHSEFTAIDSFTVYKTIALNHIVSSTNKKPTFSWIKTDAPYTLQIDTVLISTNDTFYIPTSDLSTKMIYWRVKDIHGIFTNMDSFTVYKTLVLNHIASSNNKKPTFSWNKTDTSYTLQIDTLKSFVTPIKNITVKDTLYTMTTDLPIKIIYWRVSDSHGVSAIDSFTVLNSVSILNGENSYSSYKIITCKNSIAIILHNSQASLTIYNIKGQILKYISSNSNIIFKYETSGAYISIIKVNNQTFKKLNVIR